MTSENIKKMVDRFLGWPLPKDFAPDCGISFKRESDHEHPVYGRTVFEPVGTNLFTADQAKAMFEYVLADQLASPQKDAENPDELSPPELLASRLITAWCNAHGKQIPWAKAIEITAIVTKMPEEERLRLLALDDGA